jgi:hypothetical protein
MFGNHSRWFTLSHVDCFGSAVGKQTSPGELKDARDLTNHQNGEGKQRRISGVRPSVGVLGRWTRHITIGTENAAISLFRVQKFMA